MLRTLLPGAPFLHGIQLNADGWPTLDPALQGNSAAITDLICYGSRPRHNLTDATLHFYTDDYRWLHLAHNPDQLINRQPAQVIECNFSTGPDVPLAAAVATLWYKRALAQYWQREARIRIFIDLFIEPILYATATQALPTGWKAFWTRFTSEAELNAEITLARTIAAGAPLDFNVSGGGKAGKRAALTAGVNWHPLRHRNHNRITPHG